MGKKQTYLLSLEWMGNKGQGTVIYRSHQKAHEKCFIGKAPNFKVYLLPTIIAR